MIPPVLVKALKLFRMLEYLVLAAGACAVLLLVFIFLRGLVAFIEWGDRWSAAWGPCQ